MPDPSKRNPVAGTVRTVPKPTGIVPNDIPILRACTADDASFERLVRAWEATGPIDDIPGDHIRFLPFLYRRAENLGVRLRDHGIAKGVYTKAWYHHYVDHSQVLVTLEQQGILKRALLLKGHALHALVYKDDPPTRPSADVDILVRREDRYSAARALIDSGFHPAKHSPVWIELLLRKSLGLQAGPRELDLHWGLFDFCPDPELERRLFERSIEVQLRGKRYRTLSATDHVLHTLLHGAPKNEVSPARWVLDAHQLIISTDIDWELFVNEVARNGWAFPIARQLTFLRETFGTPVPSTVVDSIAKIRAHPLVLGLVRRNSSNRLWVLSLSRIVFRDQILITQTLGLRWNVTYLVLFAPLTTSLLFGERVSVFIQTGRFTPPR